jgi:hypothetical protein
MIMHKKGQGEYILLIVFVLGIIVELFYVINIITSDNSFDVILERTFIAGIITSILIILVIVLIRQRNLADQIRRMDFSKPERDPQLVRKELAGLYRDLGALKIMAKDGLIDKGEYSKKKAQIDSRIKKKKEEIKSLEKA